MDLKSILNRGERNPPRILIYGEIGIGKTTWANTYPHEKSIFIPIEDGTASIERSKNIANRPKTFNELNNIIDVLIDSDHPFKLVILDSATKIEQLIYKEVEKEKEVNNIGLIGWQNGYKIAARKFEIFLDKLDTLRIEKKMIIIFTSHVLTEPVRPPIGEDYMKYSLSLHKKSKAKVEEWADIITFLKYDFFVDEEEKKIVSKGERVLYLVKNPGYDSKCRYRHMPDTINFNNIDKGLNKFLKILKKAIKKGEK